MKRIKIMRRFASLTLLSTLCATLYAQETQESFSGTPSSVTEEADAAPISLSTELHSSVPGVPSSASRPYAVYAQPEAQTTGHTSRYVAKGGHRGFDVGVDLGFLAYTSEGGGGAFSPVVSAGKRFSKNIYAGVDAGANVPFNGGSTFGLFAGDFRFYVPLENPRFAPGGMLQVGYEGDFDLHSYVMIQVMPIFQFGITKTVDFNIGVGYTECIGVGGMYSSGNNFGAVTAKFGFGFHMPSDKAVRIRPKLSEKPIRENGIQLTLEGDFMAGGHIDNMGEGGSLVATYKYDPHISFGLGFGFDALNAGLINKNGVTTEYTSPSKKESIDLECSHFFTKKLFLRGAYRILDQRHSPLVACDLGLFFQSKYKGEHCNKSGVYVTPSVGYSLRLVPNSFIDVKVGYTASSTISEKYTDEGKSSKTTYGKLPISGLYLSLVYTHTFKWGQNWRKKH